MFHFFFSEELLFEKQMRIYEFGSTRTLTLVLRNPLSEIPRVPRKHKRWNFNFIIKKKKAYLSCLRNWNVFSGVKDKI